METDRKSNAAGDKPFFQDPQKLTFALGLSSGLAIMAIVGFVIVSVRDGNASDTTAFKKTNTNAAATNTAAAADDSTQFDPTIIAASIGIDQNKFKTCLDSNKYNDRVSKDQTEGDAAGVNGTPTTFVNGTAVSGAQPYSVLKAAIDAALNGTKGSANVPDVAKDDHIVGGKNPKVYLIEYSDFQCPFCLRFAPTVKQALTEYGDKIALVYRHYPLESLHPYARPLALGSECVTELGGKDKFWEYHDKVFEG